MFVWTFFTFALEQQKTVAGVNSGNGIPGTKRYKIVAVYMDVSSLNLDEMLRIWSAKADASAMK